MNWQDIAIGLLSVGAAAVGWFLRQIWDAVGVLKSELHKLENDMRTNFARRDDVREMFQQLLDELRALGTKIDGKADK
jgi:hypothetical protein